MDVGGLASSWLSLPELAESIGEPFGKVRQLVREGKLVAISRGESSAKQVPGEFVRDGRLIKGLTGTVTVLRDAGFTDEEALRWLLSEDDGLAARPVDAMAEGRDTAVKRRAQVLGF